MLAEPEEHSFLHSAMYTFFIDQSQHCIEQFVRRNTQTIDSSIFEALEISGLIGSILSYNPREYAVGYSERYQQSWDKLKQQATLVKFIGDLVFARGKVCLTPTFKELVHTAESRKQFRDQEIARERECMFLTRAWDLYAMRGEDKDREHSAAAVFDDDECIGIDFDKVEELRSAIWEDVNVDKIPDLVADPKYLTFFKEFVENEAFVYRTLLYDNSKRRQLDNDNSVTENKENVRQKPAQATDSGSSETDDDRLTIVSSPVFMLGTPSSHLNHTAPAAVKKLKNPDTAIFDKTPAQTPASTPIKQQLSTTCVKR